MAKIASVSAQRTLYDQPMERAAKKDIGRIDQHIRTFIAHAPFCVISSTGANGRCDASPRGDAAGFVRVLDDRTLRDRLWTNVRRMRSGLTSLGFRIGATESPIIAIEIGSAEQTVAAWSALLDAGVYTNIVLPPACRSDRCLLRSSYSAAHTTEQIDRALGVFEQVGVALALIGAEA